MNIDEIKVTTSLLYEGALIFAILDIIFLAVISSWIKVSEFTQMKWELAGVAFLIWILIWSIVLCIFWETVYSYVFPEWIRPWIPLLFGFIMGLVSYFLWRSSIKFKRFPIIFFCLCTGLWGVLTHIWAIFRGILTGPPMLRGTSWMGALTIAFFEYIFYWCIIIILAYLIKQVFDKVRVHN